MRYITLFLSVFVFAMLGRNLGSGAGFPLAYVGVGALLGMIFGATMMLSHLAERTDRVFRLGMVSLVFAVGSLVAGAQAFVMGMVMGIVMGAIATFAALSVPGEGDDEIE